ncbi:hypothetical protein M407DRAFT_21104 [Tulasnella calospora MUT 4182]|uniref:Methyltransferase domain-containing protein n=1 Tax=Tulasnella calospora MUT 4182 TaxID=1051891 RepID=A0A0C3QNX8_9AGAM|nr:hypothetical protein M407DRAFT_21104 [Tulasnella calospora MUT 4182]
MQGSYDDAWSPQASDFTSSSHPSAEREESAGDSGSGRNSPSLSVYSYHSSVDGSAMLRNIHGRTFNNSSDNYMLPADVAEHGRLDLQHEMLWKKRGGLFYAPQAVRRALAPREGSRPSILDVGSGSGSWVIEMGRQFPHAEVVGLDLAPANLSSAPPSNCRFECDDANLGLLHYKGCFDVVHASCVTLGITNYRKFMDEVVEILRPSGVFLTVAGDMQIHDENHNLLPLIDEGEPGFTYTLRLIHAILDAMRAKGPGIDAYPKIYSWLQDQGNAWEDIGQKIVYIPIGPWEDGMSSKDKQISELMRQDFLRLIQSVRPLLLSYGWFEETVDKWSAGAQEETKILKNKYYIRWFFTWAIKPGQTI